MNKRLLKYSQILLFVKKIVIEKQTIIAREWIWSKVYKVSLAMRISWKNLRQANKKEEKSDFSSFYILNY